MIRMVYQLTQGSVAVRILLDLVGLFVQGDADSFCEV